MAKKKKVSQAEAVQLSDRMTAMEAVLGKLESCVYLPVSQALRTVLPEKDFGDFWSAVSEDAPFSWGDNNRSLITAEYFARHCATRLELTRKNKQVLFFLLSLGDMYLDLEN